MSFTVIIPSRYGSTRLEGKPLLEINGLPMVQHVYQQAEKSAAENVYVATDDARIFEQVEAFGGKALMTRGDHVSGTDRLQECVEILSLPAGHCVVNVQGDEPEIPPGAINQVANLLMDTGFEMATLSEAIDTVAQLFDPNIVKVVSAGSQALYFSRAPIPWARDDFKPSFETGSQPEMLPATGLFQRHIGIYAYKASLLNEFVSWPEGQLEACEKLEQLRVLENARRIAIAPASVPVPPGIDTVEDLEAARARMS